MRSYLLVKGSEIGHGDDLYVAYPVVKETFDTASRILGYDLRELIDSNEEKLNQTRYTQPPICDNVSSHLSSLSRKWYHS